MSERAREIFGEPPRRVRCPVRSCDYAVTVPGEADATDLEVLDAHTTRAHGYPSVYGTVAEGAEAFRRYNADRGRVAEGTVCPRCGELLEQATLLGDDSEGRHGRDGELARYCPSCGWAGPGGLQ